MSDVDALEFRRALSRFATGVTVVGTEHLGGGVCGLTANAFSSVSLDPPLVLVCVDRSANTYGCLVANGFFAVSFLAADQHHVSGRFAQRRDDKFDLVRFRLGVTGAPIVEAAVGHVECTVEAEHPGGDHGIVVGRVVAAEATDGSEPLVFYGGAYTTTAEPFALRRAGEA